MPFGARAWRHPDSRRISSEAQVPPYTMRSVEDGSTASLAKIKTVAAVSPPGPAAHSTADDTAALPHKFSVERTLPAGLCHWDFAGWARTPGASVVESRPMTNVTAVTVQAEPPHVAPQTRAPVPVSCLDGHAAWVSKPQTASMRNFQDS